MSSYSHYRGRSCGRLLHCVEVYCDIFCYWKDWVKVGHNALYYGRNPDGNEKKIANVTWPEDENDDVPHIEWIASALEDGYAARFEKAQYLSLIHI